MKGFNEEQLILRVPEALADKLNAMFEQEGDDKPIEITPKLVIGKASFPTVQFDFAFDGFHSKATLVELPCVIESHKSLDDATFFKTGNVSQMIYVHPNNEDVLENSYVKST